MDNNTLHILLIEDNSGDVRLLREMLTETKGTVFTLIHSGTLSDGLQELRLHPFDVVLLDFGLPDSNGLDAIQEIRKLTQKVPIVMLTGRDDEKTAMSALQAGVQDYLIKGQITSGSLLRSLRYAIERKSAEKSLQESAERYKVLLQTAMDGFWRVDMQGRLVEVNESYCRMSGYSEQELLAMRISDLEVNETDYEVATHTQKIIAQGEDRFESRHRRKDGSIYYVEVSVQYRPIEGGQFVGFLRDITGRKQIENELLEHKSNLEELVNKRTEELVAVVEKLADEINQRHETEKDRERLYVAAESAPDLILITDSAGEILYANPVVESITGYSREEVIGKDLHFLDSGSHDEIFYESVRAKMKHGKGWNGQLISKKKDGTLYHEECSISPIHDPLGRNINYVSVRRDITDKLRLESIAEAVNTMNNIGYVFSGIRHEIGNPINSIKMVLTVLRANMDNYSKEAVQGYIERMQDELLKIEYLLNNLKTFNMYETPVLQDINLPDFLEKFLSLSKNDYEKKGIIITSFVGPGADYCHADPRALQQVLLNIFTNAVDACADAPAPEIFISASKSSGKIQLRVSDNGCGITDEQQNNLFKPFYTSKADGTGLGLVIAKKMLAKISASIEVKSRLNEGTEVCIIIPEGLNGN